MKDTTVDTQSSCKAPVNRKDLIYQLHGFPPFGFALTMGLQHVLAMFTSNLVPCFIIARAFGLGEGDTVIMVQCAMLVSGVTTLFQLYPLYIFGKKNNLPRIGAELPIVMGTSFAFVPTAMKVGNIAVLLGGVFLGSFVEFFMGFFIRPLKKFFPPLVIGAVLIAIGINLLMVGADYWAGGRGVADYASSSNMLLGFIVFLTVLLCQRYGKGMVPVSSLLIGLTVGFVVSLMMGKLDFSRLFSAQWLAVPMPFHFGMEFRFETVLAFAILYVVSGLETIGNTSGITVAAFDREATIDETAGAIMADSFGSMLASMFNTMPNTAFGQNAGIVAMTKVVNKFCIATGAGVLIISGFVPKIGALFSMMPNSVLGGALIMVFAMIMINGLKLIAKAGFSQRNVIVLAITLALGMGIGGGPRDLLDKLPMMLQFVFKDSVVAVCIVGIAVNVLFPMDKDTVSILDLD